MPRVRLTEITVQNLKSKAQTRYWDTILPGFGVLVGKTRKSFIVVHGKKRKMTTIGHWPELSIAKARLKASHALSSGVSENHDAETLIDEYLSTKIRPSYRPSSAYQVERIFKRTKELFAGRVINAITTKELIRHFDGMKSCPSEANHVFGVLRTFFAWCERRRYVETSPLNKLAKPYKERPRDRTLDDDEIRKIFAALGNSKYHLIVRFCFFTGQRRGEVSAIQNAWIRDEGVTFPSIITKNGREHYLPLGASLLATAQQIAAAPAFANWGHCKSELDNAAGVTGWTLHDIRRTWATKAAEWDIAQPHIIERILNHAAPQALGGHVGIIYNRYRYHEEMRAALAAFEKKLNETLKNKSAMVDMATESPLVTSQLAA